MSCSKGRAYDFSNRNLNAEKVQVTAALAVANILMLLFFNGLVTKLSNKVVYLPKKMVVGHGAELSALKVEPSAARPSMKREGDAHAAHKPSEINELQMRKHEVDKKIDEDRLKQGWRNDVKIATAT